MAIGNTTKLKELIAFHISLHLSSYFVDIETTCVTENYLSIDGDITGGGVGMVSPSRERAYFLIIIQY